MTTKRNSEIEVITSATGLRVRRSNTFDAQGGASGVEMFLTFEEANELLDKLSIALDDPGDALAWKPTFGSTIRERSLSYIGDRAKVVELLRADGFTSENGYEIEEMTDQIDVFKFTRAGRRVKRFTLMP